MSSNSSAKSRPPTFDREAIFKTLLENSSESSSFTVILDTKATDPLHFTQKIDGMHAVTIKQGAFGSDAASFRQVLYHVMEKMDQWSDDDVVCFLEDDYLVSSDWISLVREGLSISDYVTLYDHPDKYSDLYKNIPCLLFKLRRYWRTTPSTTNSYAMKLSTLKRDLAIHFKSCEGNGVTRDHAKFLELWASGYKLVSCIPSAWSHEEQEMAVEIT